MMGPLFSFFLYPLQIEQKDAELSRLQLQQLRQLNRRTWWPLLL